MVTSSHTAVEVNELSLSARTIVAVIKMSDPMGGSDRWVADDGGEYDRSHHLGNS